MRMVNGIDYGGRYKNHNASMNSSRHKLEAGTKAVSSLVQVVPNLVLFSTNMF